MDEDVALLSRKIKRWRKWRDRVFEPDRGLPHREKEKGREYHLQFLKSLDRLAALGPSAAAAVPALREALLDVREGDDNREAVVRVLAAIRAPEAVAALIQYGEIVCSAKQTTVVEILGSLGEAGAQAVPSLVRWAEEVEGSRRPQRPLQPAPREFDKECFTSAVLKALRAIGPAASAAVPHLLRWCGPSPPFRLSCTIRCQLLDALGSIGPGAAAAVPYLVEVLETRLEWAHHSGARSDHRALQTLALEVLGKIGPAAREMVPRLRRCSAKHDQPLRLYQALRRVDPAAAREHARERLRWRLDMFKNRPSADQWDLTLVHYRNGGSDFLEELMTWPEVKDTPEGKEAVLFFRVALREGPPSFRYFAAYGLAWLGESGEALPVLLEAANQCVESNNYDFRDIAKALGQIGPAARAAIPALTAALAKARFPIPAAEALWRIGEPAIAVPALIGALKRGHAEPEFQMVREANRVLGLVGEGAKDAVPALIAVLHDPAYQFHEDFIDEVRETLSKIAPAANPSAGEGPTTVTGRLP